MKNFKFSRWSFDHNKIDAMITGNSNPYYIVMIFLRLKLIIGGLVTGRLFTHTWNFISFLIQIRTKNGLRYLVLYLKACSVALQQAASGFYISNIGSISGPRPSRTNSGLPRIIPAEHRLIIINYQPGWNYILKYWLTMLAIFRVIVIPCIESLDTITAMGKIFNVKSYVKFMTHFLNIFIKNRIFRFEPWSYITSRFKYYSIMTSSVILQGYYASHPVSMVICAQGVILSAIFPAFFRLAFLMGLIKLPEELANAACIDPSILSKLGMSQWDYAQLANWYNQILQSNKPIYDSLRVRLDDFGKPQLGRLGFKVEAAGKLRVFAMVDPWTQWLLYPLHKLIFKILSIIPMDGTFNQLRPIYRLIRRAKSNNLPLYSLDLSAATDRLPILLQKELLNKWFGSKFGDSWSILLVGRKYFYKLPSGVRGWVQYSVGQPMGALSSWAMLALTHHFIVQYAAWKSQNINMKKFVLFKDYALLGDDLVIANKAVKDQYLAVLADLGVKCGLHKSILSSDGSGLEFAKRTFVRGLDVSPIPLKELSSALDTPSSFAAFAQKYNMNFAKQVKFLGYGFRVLGKCQDYYALNKALKCLYFANITKASFTTDTLSLGKFWHKLQSHSIIATVVSNFIAHHLETTKNRINDVMDSLEFSHSFGSPVAGTGSRLTLLTFVHHSLITNGIRYAHKLVAGSDVDRMASQWRREGLREISYPLTLNGIVQLYIKLQNFKSILSLDAIEIRPRRVISSQKFPFQQRLFHIWSKIVWSTVNSRHEIKAGTPAAPSLRSRASSKYQEYTIFYDLGIFIGICIYIYTWFSVGSWIIFTLIPWIIFRPVVLAILLLISSYYTKRILVQWICLLSSLIIIDYYTTVTAGINDIDLFHWTLSHCLTII